MTVQSGISRVFIHSVVLHSVFTAWFKAEDGSGKRNAHQSVSQSECVCLWTIKYTVQCCLFSFNMRGIANRKNRDNLVEGVKRKRGWGQLPSVSQSFSVEFGGWTKREGTLSFRAGGGEEGLYLTSYRQGELNG